MDIQLVVSRQSIARDAAREGTSSEGNDSEMMQAQNTSASPTSVPVPGLPVLVREENEGTPLATYEVLTDIDGKLSASIEVASNSDIVVESGDEALAKFSISGAASEFSTERRIEVEALPMLEATGACRITEGDDEFIRFIYRNINESQSPVHVPVTALDPRLYRQAEISSDDLALNHIGYDTGDVALPENVDVLSGEAQVFEPGESSFEVRYNPSLGGLTWTFIGQQIRVDTSTPQCLNEGTAQCGKISDEMISQIWTQVRATVTATLRLASKSWKKGPSPYLKSAARTLRETRATLAKLKNLYSCPAQVSVKFGCRRVRFPTDELMKSHANLFRVKSKIRRAAFRKINSIYGTRFNRFLSTTFPREVVSCTRE